MWESDEINHSEDCGRWSHSLEDSMKLYDKKSACLKDPVVIPSPSTGEQTGGTSDLQTDVMM